MTIIELINRANSILIIGHQRPDGDCIGAGLALRHIAEKHGKLCDFVFDSPVPGHFSFLPDYAALNEMRSTEYDTVIAVDCADSFRMSKFMPYMAKARASWNVDHHLSNNRFAKENTVVKDASSTCEVLFDMLEPLGEIDETAAYYLFVGLSTDTGHFMHSNTSTHVFEVAAELSRKNVNASAMAQNLYKNTTYNKVKLISRAIESMRFFADGKIAVINIRSCDLDDCGCVMADTEGIIDYAMMIGTVEVGLCVSEYDSNVYKVSYRSKSVDVAAAASVFGGGGHKLAAGCSVHGKYEDVLRKVVKSVTDGMPV